MEFTGKVVSLSRNYETGKYQITFEVNEKSCIEGGYDKIKSCEKLSITAAKYREKRSLDANAYFHVLVGKIADVFDISKTRCKNILIGRYGQMEFIDGQPVTIKTQIPISDMLEQENLHCLPCGGKQENGVEIFFYRVYRGSHTYDSKEMSTLIGGVVQEAKEIGIETLPPEELEKLYNGGKVKK